MVCDKFEKYVLPDLDISALKGCDLVCHCAPRRCHGDSILRKANSLMDDEYEIYRLGDHALAHGDCLEVMQDIEDASVDLILCDLPYGTTYAPWDSVIPLNDLWSAYNRIIKPNAAIVLTASQPFTSALVMSNTAMFRCEWIWDKVNGANFANAKKQPLKTHESVLVFSKKQPVYNPQMTAGKPNHSTGKSKSLGSDLLKIKERAPDITTGLKYPKSIQVFPKHSSQCRNHPTEKPVDLLAYLIRTYSNPGDLVLDNTMGSGSTGVACIREGRRFRGIEKERKYFDIACERVSAAVSEANTQ